MCTILYSWHCALYRGVPSIGCSYRENPPRYSSRIRTLNVKRITKLPSLCITLPILTCTPPLSILGTPTLLYWLFTTMCDTMYGTVTYALYSVALCSALCSTLCTVLCCHCSVECVTLCTILWDNNQLQCVACDLYPLDSDQQPCVKVLLNLPPARHPIHKMPQV